MDPDPLSCLLNILALDQQAITVNTPTVGSIIAIIIALFALMYSAYNSGSELAYFSLSKEDIDSIDDESKQERIKQLLSKPERLLATILIGNNSVNVLIAVQTLSHNAQISFLWPELAIIRKKSYKFVRF